MTARAMEAGEGRRKGIGVKLLFKKVICEIAVERRWCDDFDDRVNGDVLRLPVYGDILRIARIS
jgi:hypothetical protein